LQLQALKDFKVLRFCSTLEKDDDKYQFKIQGTNKVNGKEAEYEKKVSVANFYDSKGYLHRYKVKEFLDESISQFIKKRQ